MAFFKPFACVNTFLPNKYGIVLETYTDWSCILFCFSANNVRDDCSGSPKHSSKLSP
uniref:Uncharacterized protein n=1 Tax=Fundulus heteroclitus TaxID=8078 RepID=A0A3Q2QRD2_FUNHE